jgi:hypothetical protein
MRFFAKFVFVCNLSFLISVVLRFVEFGNDQLALSNDTLGFQPLKSTLIVLGYGAVFFNFVFLSFLVFKKLFNGELNIPMWISIVNFFFFVLQVVYFFS